MASPLGNQLSIERGQTGQVCYLCQQFGLERLQARGQRCTALQNLLGADEPKGRVLGQALGVVDILIARQAAVYRLPHQVGQRQLSVLSPPVRQVPFDEFAEPNRSSSSRTSSRPPSEVTRAPWNSTRNLPLNES
jgi:hypothetical protein